MKEQTTKSLGQQLKEYHDLIKEKQLATSIRWLEKTGETFSPETVETRLSNCFKDISRGIRFFFFEKVERANALFDVLRVPEEEWPELLKLAKSALEQKGKPTPKLVIDMCAIQTNTTETIALFTAIEKTLLEGFTEQFRLVLTTEQENAMPHSFGKRLEGRMRLEVVKNAQEGFDKLRANETEQSLVASPRYCPPFSMWIAFDFKGEQMTVAPVGWLAQWKENEELEDLPPTTHRLDTICSVAQLPIDVRHMNGIEIRQLLLSVNSGSGIDKLTQGQRLSLAQQFNIVAASTEQERIEHALATLQRGLPFECKQTTNNDLQRLLAKAQRRPIPTTLLRIEENLHLINPPQELNLSEHPQLIIHQVSCATPMITRIRKALESYTYDDFIDDPRLLRLEETLQLGKEEPALFLHARATLVHSGEVKIPAPKPSGDWKKGLAALLQGTPPTASLLLRNPTEASIRTNKTGYAAPTHFIASESYTDAYEVESLRNYGYSHQDQQMHRAELNRQLRNCLLLQVPPVADLLLSPGEPLSLVDTTPQRDQDGDDYDDTLWRARETQPDMLFRLSPHQSESDWLDLIDGSPALGGDFNLQRNSSRWSLELPIRRWNVTQHTFPPTYWHQVDRLLAVSWLALQRALANEEATILHDGTVLLLIGAGLYAEINVRENSSPDKPVRASLLQTCWYGGKWKFDPLTTFVVLASSQSSSTAEPTPENAVYAPNDLIYTHTGLTVPRELYLSGNGFAANIRFGGSPFFMNAGNTILASAAYAARPKTNTDDTDDE